VREEKNSWKRTPDTAVWTATPREKPSGDYHRVARRGFAEGGRQRVEGLEHDLAAQNVDCPPVEQKDDAGLGVAVGTNPRRRVGEKPRGSPR